MESRSHRRDLKKKEWMVQARESLRSMRDTAVSPADSAQLAVSLGRLVTQQGLNLGDLSARSPVLLVFLRHSGCVFCRQTLSDLARDHGAIVSAGVHVVLVHMGDSEQLLPVLETYGLSGIDRICDGEQLLYRAFGLKRGTLGQLFGPAAIWRGLVASFVGGHGFALPKADARQMPGIFLLEECSVVGRFRHRSIASRPDLAAIACARESQK